MSVFSAESQCWMLKLMTERLTLHLFSNDVKPSAKTTLKDFREVSGGGYAHKILLSEEWSISKDSPVTAEMSPQTWRFDSGTGLVYGYFFKSPSGVYVTGERFSDGPYDVRYADETITVRHTLVIGNAR